MRVCVLGESRFVPARHLVTFLVGRGDDVHAAGFGPLDFAPPVTAHALKFRSRLGLLAARPAVRDLVRRIRPDVVHAFYLTSYGYLASRVEGVPVLATAMGTDVFGAPELSRWLQPLRDRLVRAAVSRADRIHSVADHMTERLVMLGARRSAIVTFPRGVEARRFRIAREMSSHDATLRVACTRKLEPVYDHETLLDGVARYRSLDRPLTLTLVGSGYLRPSLERKVEALALGGVVTFEGERDHDAMPRVYQAADVYASASLSDGTSSCLLEAMAAGCIPVVSDVPANRAWIEDGRNGFLFRVGDPGMLARALERAVEARAQWPEIRKGNLELVERRGSREAGLNRVAHLYDELVARGAA